MSLTAVRRSRHGGLTSIDTWRSVPFALLGQTPYIATSTYPTANLAIYTPVVFTDLGVVKKLWVASSTIGTGNFDVGLYNSAGTRLVSTGSTAKGTTTTEQIVDVTDTTVLPGLYYIGFNCSNNTDSFNVTTTTAPYLAASGVLTEAVGSVTLPATATWTVDQTLTKVITCGVLMEATAA